MEVGTVRAKLHQAVLKCHLINISKLEVLCPFTDGMTERSKAQS